MTIVEIRYERSISHGPKIPALAINGLFPGLKSCAKLCAPLPNNNNKENPMQRQLKLLLSTSLLAAGVSSIAQDSDQTWATYITEEQWQAVCSRDERPRH